MRGTAANMEIQENLAMALRRGKSRTRLGHQKNEKDFYREALAARPGASDPYDQQSGLTLRRTAPGAHPSDGNPPEAKALLRTNTPPPSIPKQPAKSSISPKRL